MGGCSSKHTLEGTTINFKFTMKAFVATIFSLVASAVAEADPYWTPAVYTTSGLVAHANGALVPDYTPAQKAAAAQHLTAKANEYAFKGYGLGLHHAFHPYAALHPYHYGKREAEADAYWTPAIYTPSGLVAHANGALVPDYTPAQKAAAAQHLTAKANEYAFKGYGLHAYHPYAAGYPYAGLHPYHYGKREAEADADADAYWTPAVYTPSGLVAHANGALVPDYTPAQKAAAAQHLTAKANEYAFKGYGYGLHHAYHPYAAGYPYAAALHHPYAGRYLF